jgi:hypothetical protein
MARQVLDIFETDYDYIIDMFSKYTEEQIAKALKCSLRTLRSNIPEIYTGGLRLNDRKVLSLLIDSEYEIGPKISYISEIYYMLSKEDKDGNRIFSMTKDKIGTILENLNKLGKFKKFELTDDGYIKSILLCEAGQKEGRRRKRFESKLDKIINPDKDQYYNPDEFRDDC